MWYNDTVHLNELSRLLHKRRIVCVGLENKASICQQVCLRFVQQGELVYWTGGRTMSLRYQAIWIIDLVHREPRAGACHIHNRHWVKEWKIRPTVHLRTLGSPNVGLWERAYILNKHTDCKREDEMCSELLRSWAKGPFKCWTKS